MINDNSCESTKVNEIRLIDFVIKPYLRRSNAKAFWQVLSTLAPIAGLWWLIARVTQTSLSFGIKGLALIPVLGLLTLFSSRVFSLMHDCGHGSLFKTSWINRTIGFFLGCLNAIPQYPWSRDHAFHHRHNGNWEIYRGPIDVITLEEYQDLPERNKLLYSISRHWLMLFPGGFYYLVFKPRLALLSAMAQFVWSIAVELLEGLKQRNWSKIFVPSSRLRSHHSGYGNTFGEMKDLIANNFIVIIGWVLMSRWLGAGVFWSCYSIVMTFSAAIFICIFFVQHNFKGSYANGTNDWSSMRGAIEGSSNLDLPHWLNWFFADISFHSLHHICDRIPNYHLRTCHMHNQHLLNDARTLRLVDIPSCFDYILWDAKLQQLSTVKIAEKSL